MENQQAVPFNVGQLLESKSFQAGFRGAWFRCRVQQIVQQKFALEYYDYPDEKITWMRKIYQRAPWKPKGAKELMLRPEFPPVFRKGEDPDANTISEVILVRDGGWKIGDLVDWFNEGAYWSGEITEVLNTDEVMVELNPCPAGEGESYKALCKDLRPSLEWSEESGWSVLAPKGIENCQPCARLIQPGNQVDGRSDEVDRDSISGQTVTEPETLAPQQPTGSDANGEDSVAANELGLDNTPNTTLRKQDAVSFGRRRSDTDSMESLLAAHEELLNKVKWVRSLLGPRKSVEPGWEFIEHRPGAPPK